MLRDKNKIKILYVDDEDNNLNSFKASLRKEYQVITAISAEEGLDAVQKEEFQVVLADQRMPGMTGVEFFEKLMRVNPDPVRILLTGYSDIASVIDAINKGEVYRFIDKPWNIEHIKNAIENAVEMYQTKKELKSMNERLKKVYLEMNQFVYALSHELRGPLMSISGVSKMAKSEVTDPVILEYFDMIDASTHRLDDFIHKMLDFYRTTKMENKISNIDFRQIVDQQLQAYHSKWDLSAFKINVNVIQTGSFYSDEAKIRVILNNLFTNSYKFQNDDRMDKYISIKVTADEDQATILIEDNGVGIDIRYQDNIFGLFHRATQKNVGTGLGLYMVKESVNLLGGEIGLESELGKGTKVTVIIPSMDSHYVD